MHKYIFEKYKFPVSFSIIFTRLYVTECYRAELNVNCTGRAGKRRVDNVRTSCGTLRCVRG